MVHSSLTEQPFSSFIRKIYSWGGISSRSEAQEISASSDPFFLPIPYLPVSLPKVPALDYVEISALLLSFFSVLLNIIDLNFLLDDSLSDSGAQGLGLVSESPSVCGYVVQHFPRVVLRTCLLRGIQSLSQNRQ